jgi:hypothetical protein
VEEFMNQVEAPAEPPVRSPQPVDPPPGTPESSTDRPADPAAGRALVASLIAGAVGAVAVPLTRPGVGWLLAGTASLAAVAVGVRPRRPLRPHSLALLGAAVLLVASGALRAAGWLYVLCLFTALGLVSYALTDGGTAGWGALARRGLALVPAGGRALGWMAAAAARDSGEVRRAGRVAVGLVVSAVLLLVFGGLFASADPVFADLMSSNAPELSAGRIVSAVVLFLLVGGVTATAAYQVSDLDRAVPDAAGEDRRTIGLLDWAIPLAALDVLFAVFIGVQVSVLFRGHDYVLGPDGPTYAEYARGGFWQLSTATALALGVVAVLARVAGRERPTDRLLLRLLGGALCLFSLVIVASALRRMGLYVQAYGFTRPRLIAFTGEVMLGCVFVLLLVAGVRLRARWLPRISASVAVALLFALVAVNPDRYVAHTVIGRFRQDRHLDMAYLQRLSPDAVAEIDQLPEPERSCTLLLLADDLRRPDPWYAYNAGREQARAILKAHPVDRAAGPCYAYPHPFRDG